MVHFGSRALSFSLGKTIGIVNTYHRSTSNGLEAEHDTPPSGQHLAVRPHMLAERGRRLSPRPAKEHALGSPTYCLHSTQAVKMLGRLPANRTNMENGLARLLGRLLDPNHPERSTRGLPGILVDHGRRNQKNSVKRHQRNAPISSRGQCHAALERKHVF